MEVKKVWIKTGLGKREFYQPENIKEFLFLVKKEVASIDMDLNLVLSDIIKKIGGKK